MQVGHTIKSAIPADQPQTPGARRGGNPVVVFPQSGASSGQVALDAAGFPGHVLVQEEHPHLAQPSVDLLRRIEAHGQLAPSDDGNLQRMRPILRQKRAGWPALV